MQQLFPFSGSDTKPDVNDFYARDWLDTGGVRVNFVASVDGAVTVSGKSSGLQTHGDNVIFAALRDLADVVLVGAGTARTEGYRALKQSDERQARRQANGLDPNLPLAIVTRSLGVDPDSALFTGAVPTLIFTCAAAKPAAHRELATVAEIIVCGDDEVDLSQVHGVLTGRGHARVLCEGGPSLFADLARTGNVTELCLTISPLVAGPGSGRIMGGPEWASDAAKVELAGLLEEDGALFARYQFS